MIRGSAQRAKFFAGVSPLFGGFNGSGGRIQIEGLDLTLDRWIEPKQRSVTSIPQFAYMLATKYHETAHTMWPVIETFNLKYDKPGVNPSVETAIARLDSAWNAGRLPWVKAPYWRKDKNGKSWLGRGDVQLTHESNYQNAQDKTGIRCHDDPGLMLVPENALTVLFRGMEEGWFTGKRLDQIIDDRIDGDELADFIAARPIINGRDRAAEIAQEGTVFLRALRAADAA